MMQIDLGWTLFIAAFFFILGWQICRDRQSRKREQLENNLTRSHVSYVVDTGRLANALRRIKAGLRQLDGTGGPSVYTTTFPGYTTSFPTELPSRENQILGMQEIIDAALNPSRYK